MIKNVVADLRVFLMFYLVFLIMFSNVLSILGLENFSPEQLEDWQDKGYSNYPGSELKYAAFLNSIYDFGPCHEVYRKIPIYLGHQVYYPANHF